MPNNESEEKLVVLHVVPRCEDNTKVTSQQMENQCDGLGTQRVVSLMISAMHRSMDSMPLSYSNTVYHTPW